MKRIKDIIKKQNLIPEYGYLIITKSGSIFYNGEVGFHFSKSYTGDLFCDIADKIGCYGIPDPMKFIKIIQSIKSIDSVKMDTNSNQLDIRFSGKSKGVIKVPCLLDLRTDLSHFQIEWKSYNDLPSNVSKLTDSLLEMPHLLTKEGISVWKDIVGIYGHNQILTSFDYGVYLHSDSPISGSFFMPKSLLDLGFDGLEMFYVDPNSDGKYPIYLIGEHIQCVCAGSEIPKISKDILNYKVEFEQGHKYTVSLTYDASLWKRISLITSDTIDLIILNNEVIVSNSMWSEVIGSTDLPNMQFLCRLSIFKRWVEHTTQHQISIVPINGKNKCYLYGITNAGVNFYGVLNTIRSDQFANTQHIYQVESATDSINSFLSSEESQ